MLFAPKHPVPVFPLPRVMLFPHTVLPLHVFELRYRTMVREALSGERLIALAQLQPGWEADDSGNAPFSRFGCLARFEEVEWLLNDCYHLKVRGLSRVRFGAIVKEFPYRSARVEIAPQEPYTEDDPLVEIEKRALVETCGRWMAAAAKRAGEEPPPPPSTELRYEVLVNAACMLISPEPQEQLALLEMDSIIHRGKRIRELMEDGMRGRPPHQQSGERN